MATRGLAYTQAVHVALAGAGEPLTLDELAVTVSGMPVRPSLHPERTLRGALRRSLLVARVEDGRYASILWLLKGSQFRHVLSEFELSEGCLRLGPDVCFALYPFAFASRTLEPPRPCHLSFEQGPLVSQRIEKLNGDMGIPAGYALAEWFAYMKCQPGDSLLFEATDAEQGIYHIFVEPHAQCDPRRLARRNQELIEGVTAALARKRVPCLLFRLMPALVARGIYNDPFPPLPLESIVASSPAFELVDGKVRLRPGNPLPAEPHEAAPDRAEQAKPGGGPGIFGRLLGRKG